MAAWSDGYFTDIPYTSHFYPQLAPGYLAFACLRQGMRPPGLSEGSVYLELGCGQGFGLNLLAAANPAMRFVGVDFHPGQIANAQALAAAAGLSNVTFEDFSFAQVLALPEGRIAKCDVIALHGVWSWVGPEQRREIVQILDRLLKPGGLVYVSYNALPGWAPLIGLQHFVRSHVARHPGDPQAQVMAALRAALHLADKNLAFKDFPGAKGLIETQLGESPTYLVHEYLNAESAPFFHEEVIAALEPARLSYAGTASLAEDLLNLAAPADLRAEIQAADPAWRETLLDYASGKRFRRDIFLRGRNPLSRMEIGERLAATRFALVKPRAGMSFEFPAPIGRLKGDPAVYEPIADALAEGPRTYAELAALPALANARDGILYQAIALLVGGRRIAPVQAGADPAPARAFNNAVLARLAIDQAPGYLASPVVGTGITVEFADLLGLSAIAAGEKDVGKTAARGAEILARSGSKLLTAGGAVADRPALEAELSNQLKAFSRNRLPLFKSLGLT